MGKDEETKKIIEIFVMSIKTAENKQNSHSSFNTGFLNTNEI